MSAMSASKALAATLTFAGSGRVYSVRNVVQWRRAYGLTDYTRAGAADLPLSPILLQTLLLQKQPLKPRAQWQLDQQLRYFRGDGEALKDLGSSEDDSFLGASLLSGDLPFSGSGLSSSSFTRTRRLPAELRNSCTDAVQGQALPVDRWLEISDAALEQSGVPLDPMDAILVLQACSRWNVEDPVLFAALAEDLESASENLDLEGALAALDILSWVESMLAGGARKDLAEAFFGRSIYDRLLELSLQSEENLVRTLTTFARNRRSLPGSGPTDEALRSLAGSAVGLRRLRFHEVCSLELSFEALGMLHGSLAELLLQRRRLILEAAPLSELAASVKLSVEGPHPEWLLRSEDLENELVTALESRLSEAGEEGASQLEKPFECLRLLWKLQRLPTPFLESLCLYARRATRLNGGRKGFVSPSDLTMLDDACEARGTIQPEARERLDAAIRSVVAFGVSWDERFDDDFESSSPDLQ